MRYLSVVCSLALVSMVAGPTSVALDDWAQFHHDALHSGVSTSDLSSSFAVNWTFQAGGPIYSSPVVADGRVFFTARNRWLYCLSADAGDTLWTKPLGNFWFYDTQLGYDMTIDASPLVVGDTVYVGARDGLFRAFSASTGELYWSKDLGQAIVGSPFHIPGKIFAPSVGDWGDLFLNRVWCLDPTDGDSLWSHDFDDSLVNSEIVDSPVPTIVYGDTSVVVGSKDNHLYSQPAFWVGKPENPWSYDTNCFVRSSPTVAGSRIYIGNGAADCGGLECLTTEGTWKWKYPTACVEWLCATPAVQGELVYMGGWTGSAAQVFCVEDEGNSASLVWGYDPAYPVSSDEIYSSPALAGGKLVIALHRQEATEPPREVGYLHVLDAADGDSLWCYQISDSLVLSSPAIYDEKIFIGTPEGVLYCFRSDNEYRGEEGHGDAAKTEREPEGNLPDARTRTCGLALQGIAAPCQERPAGPMEILAEPNPFHDRVRVAFHLPDGSDRQPALVDVIDIEGRLVRALAGSADGVGHWIGEWDGCNTGGRRSPAGLYFVRVRCGTIEDVHAVTLLAQ